MFDRISSKDNRKIKDTVKLISSAKYRSQTGLFVLEGVRLCCDAAQCSISIQSLFVTDDALSRYDEKVKLLTSVAAEAYIVSEDVFHKMSETVSPQGIITVCKTPDIEQNLDKISSNGKYIACENVSDPSNLGSISRTAEALAVSGMILIGNCCDPFGPKAQRASMGSLLRLPLFRFADVNSAYAFLHERSVTVYASVVDSDAEKISDVDFSDGSVIIIGNEGNGLTDEAKAVCDRRITIPITGRAESFNAASAAAILLWELMK